MKLDQVITLIVRLFVVYIFMFYVYGQMIAAIGIGLQPDQSKQILVTLVYVAAVLILSTQLWKYSPLIAKKIISNENVPSIKASLSFDEIQTLCFSCIGLFITMNGIITLAHGITFFGFKSLLGNEETNVRLPRLYFSTDIVRILVGLYVMLGSHGIIKLLKKIRGGIN